MEKDHYIGLIILLGILAIAAFGGNKMSQNFGNSPVTPQTPGQKQASIQQEISDTQNKINDLEKQIQAQKDSKYKGLVALQYVNHSSDVKSEYIVLHVSESATTTIPVTGWTLHSVPDGTTYSIPFGTQLYFSGQENKEDAVVLSPGDTAYIITGVSPIGYSFKINKCSGYLAQYQTFIPYISANCPLARDEDLSGIPKITSNDDCLDYINYYPACKTQTDNLPVSWTYECKNFITTKLTYSACVDTHKNDKDFYGKDWRIYLKRSDTIWKERREEIVLYDNEGKIVDDLKY